MAIDYRKCMEEIMRETLVDEQRYHDWAYEPIRPLYMPHRPWKPGERVVGDCSKGCQYVDWWSELPTDPMGMHFGPYGNSQTYAAHLQHADHPSELKIGDVITFGYAGSDHAAKVLEPGDNPLLWSFGHPGAPNAYRLSYDRRVHQLLKIPLPHYVATKDEILRSKHGFWAWLQWRLGEGDWKHYPPMAHKVRPRVPVVIPPHWWWHYERFLRNRHSGNKSKAETPMASEGELHAPDTSS